MIKLAGTDVELSGHLDDDVMAMLSAVSEMSGNVAWALDESETNITEASAKEWRLALGQMCILLPLLHRLRNHSVADVVEKPDAPIYGVQSSGHVIG